MADYYGTLGISKDASEGDIKKAYRKLALKYHPDRNEEKDKAKSEKKFKEISEAYEVLSDPEKKKIYDQFGEEGLKNGGMPGGNGGSFNFGQGGGHFHPSSAENIFRTFFGGNMGESGFSFGGMDEGDFGNAFGGMGGGFGGRPRSSRRSGPPPGVPKVAKRKFYCTLEELFTGCTKKMKVTRKIQRQGQVDQVEKILVINVKPGWKSGTKLTFNGEGDEYDGFTQDIEFVLDEKQHEIFTRDSDDLKSNVNITLKEALLGCYKEVEGIEGNRVSLNLPALVKNGQIIRVSGRGMPNQKTNIRGDLLVTVNVVLPSSLTFEQKRIIEENF